jgi:nucleoside-diphosphate-sugar epimerase
MLGSDLVKNLDQHFVITPIFKENYSKYVSTKFDIVINANGNSRRFWANQNPKDDFIASTDSVHKSIFDFPCNLYIYISSPDVYADHGELKHTREDYGIDSTKLSPYGFHKYLGELIVRKYSDKFLILRPSMILGANLKKGPFYDIINNKSVFIKLDTRLQLITTSAISDIIKTLLKCSITNEVINVGGIGAFSFKNIHKYFDKKIHLSADAQTQTYEMNIKKIKSLYPSLMTSEEYLKEFLGNCINHD